jgi:hypothetical protein
MSTKKVSKKSSLIDLFASDIQDTAKKTGHHPTLLPWNVWLSNSSVKGTELMQQFIRSGLWHDVKRTYFPDLTDKVAKLELRDLQKRQNVSDLSNSSSRYFMDMLMGEISKLPALQIKPYVVRKPVPVSRAVTCLWGDWHIGTNMLPNESGYKFGPLEEARAVAQIVRTLLEYKTDHRDKTILIIDIIGDLLENQLHGLNNASAVPIQQAHVFSLIRQALLHLSQGYREIRVYWKAGNHDRNPIVHPKRAIHERQKQAFSTAVAMTLRQLFNVPGSNVHIYLDERPETSYDLFNFRVHSGHGDLFTTMPNPGKTLNVNYIHSQILRLNAREMSEKRKPFEIHHVGHVHTPGVLYIDNYCKLAINGPLLPPSMHAQSVGVTTCVRGQLLYESTAAFALGDNRLIYLNGSEHDSSLDKIIHVEQDFD